MYMLKGPFPKIPSADCWNDEALRKCTPKQQISLLLGEWLN